MRRQPPRLHHPLLAVGALVVLLLLLAAILLPEPARAVGVTVTGDDGAPLGIAPGAPPTIRTLRPEVVVAGDAGGGRYSVAFADPAGRAAADPVTCQDPAIPSTARLPYRGNGRYTVAVTVFAAGDIACATPAGPAAAFQLTIAGRVVLGPLSRFVLRDRGSTRRKRLALPVSADPGSQTREVRFAASARLRRDGSIRGSSLRAPYRDGSATLLFPAPGVYTVVARDASDGVATPWSDPLRIRVVTPFDLLSLRYVDTSGPVFRVLARAPAETTGVVRVALARAGEPFRRLGRARVDAEGAFGARFSADVAGAYRLRFRYRGNGLVERGTVVRRFRVGTAIVGARAVSSGA
ncbi:MAG TPA: hypothetical protein VK506_11035 [Conexibacter sp.]|nr:hypothetical protein [Conexibacter sp.]